MELARIVSSTVNSLSPQTAAVHANAVWSFALKILTFRQEPPENFTSVRAVEDAAIALVLALTLKLTEPVFKPLFLRLVDWAAQPPASGTHPIAVQDNLAIQAFLSISNTFRIRLST